MLCGVALTGCALPFLLPLSLPEVRALATVFTLGLSFRALQFAAGHVRPQGWVDFLFFVFSTFAVVRWKTPRRPDPRRAALAFGTCLLQLGLAWLLMRFVAQLDPHHPVQLVTAQLGLYLVVAAICNFSQVKLSLRGLDYDDAFNNPLASRTPAEFWGQRWNTLISHLLHRYVFLPAGGRRHPLRGVLAAFAASGVLHEVLVYMVTCKFSGSMFAYFGLQGVLVASTSRSRFVRRLARERPVIAWALTTLVMLGTGVLFVRGLDGADPSEAWRRVFGPT